MSVFKPKWDTGYQSDIYRYDFWFNGKRYYGSTGETSKTEAEHFEHERKRALRLERDEREKKAKQLSCDPARLLRCPECEKLFNGDRPITTDDGTPLCSDSCRVAYEKKGKPVPTLREFCTNKVEPWAKARFEKTTINSWHWYRAGLRRIAAFAALADKRLSDIQVTDINVFVAHEQADDMAVSSINAVLRVLRRVLRLAVEWGEISVAPKVKLLRGERHRERVISPEEEARFIAAAPEPLASVATILADSGLRPDECYRLRWEAVSFEAGRNGMFRVLHGKTPAARRILPMTPRVRVVLKSRWEAAKKPTEGWVFPAPTESGHIDHSSIKKQHALAFNKVNEFAAKHDEQPVTPFVLYSFRHTFLTRLGERGIDPWTLARIAGHSSIEMSKRYVHPSDDAVLNAMSLVPMATQQTGDSSSADTQTAQKRLTGRTATADGQAQ